MFKDQFKKYMKRGISFQNFNNSNFYILFLNKDNFSFVCLFFFMLKPNPT